MAHRWRNKCIANRSRSARIQVCTAEPSFFYLIMAAACFRRAAGISRRNTRGALRDIGREYLNQGRSLGPEA
jgi:hypothetical protein